jgi:hypothetical protein
VEPLTRGLLPPDPRSLCPLSSNEFVEPALKKIPGYATGHAPLISTDSVSADSIIHGLLPGKNGKIKEINGS